MDKNLTQPLLPKSALEYYNDAKNNTYPMYLRAFSLRNCLEDILNKIFIYLPHKKINQRKWDKKSLNEKIILTENYFLDNGIIEKLKFIKDIGNKGHSNLKKELTDENINLALEDVSKIGEWLISTELKKSGFNIDSWLPTMFSTLPLESRVSILEELLEFYKNKDISSKKDLLDYLNYVQHTETIYMNAIASGQISFELYQELTSKPLPKQQEFSQVLLLIDKLAMAYLKNGDYQKANKFINLQFKENFINETFKSQMLDKLDSLEKAKKQLPISQSLEETKEYFKDILAVVKEEEYSLFITLFTAIVAQDELSKKIIKNK